MEAFLDGATPLEIFRRLIIGSEGTLAFIAEAVFETIADDQCRLTSFMIFPDMYAACAAVKPFVDHGAAAVELVDRASLRAIEGKPGVPDRWKALPEQATALLVEFRTPNDAARSEAERIANATLAELTLLNPRHSHATRFLRRSFGTCAASSLPPSAAPDHRAHHLFWRRMLPPAIVAPICNLQNGSATAATSISIAAQRERVSTYAAAQPAWRLSGGGRSSRCRSAAARRLFALHVPERPSPNRRWPRALGLSQEARGAEPQGRDRRTGRHARLRPGPRRHRLRWATSTRRPTAPRSRRCSLRPTSCSRSSRMSMAHHGSASSSSIISRTSR